MEKMKILAIESSCDETAAAVIEDGRRIISSVVATQIEQHKLYGGVVPEIASRLHCESICGVVNEALEKAELAASEVDAIAVTYAPGLIGALLVGVNYAKGLSFSTGLPLVPVHHLRSHIAANYITDKRNGVEWSREDLMVMQGLHSYYRMVEEKTIDGIVKHINEKMGVDVLRLIKDDLR